MPWNEKHICSKTYEDICINVYFNLRNIFTVVLSSGPSVQFQQLLLAQQRLRLAQQQLQAELLLLLPAQCLLLETRSFLNTHMAVRTTACAARIFGHTCVDVAIIIYLSSSAGSVLIFSDIWSDIYQCICLGFLKLDACEVVLTYGLDSILLWVNMNYGLQGQTWVFTEKRVKGVEYQTSWFASCKKNYEKFKMLFFLASVWICGVCYCRYFALRDANMHIK